jgi:nitroimidazol reductase NimA-like FMN-containing flavoprotein (pyridoxamine 5'-phosphate oxidase superfamily)
MPAEPTTAAPPSERATVRRLAYRGSYERDTAYAILDEGLVCHVGLVTEHGPIVIPTLYARDGDRLLLHGSVASRMLRGASKAELCVTVTLLDSLVLARSAFHHSVDYRSVVVFGQATRIDDPAGKRAALDRFVDFVVPGRSADARPPTDTEMKQTIVLSLPLDEFSVKVRDMGVVDEPEDMDLPLWAGRIPISLVAGAPIADDHLPADRPVPAYASTYRRGQ